MSNGRCNYSEYTEDEFKLLKESGDAEAGDKQGNHPVSICFTLPSEIILRPICLLSIYTIALTPA